MTVTQLTNVSNPAAFGVEWTAGETGNTYQLTNPRGTTNLLFSARHEGSIKWLPASSVVDPSRFGLTKPPTSFAAFRTVALAYING